MVCLQGIEQVAGTVADQAQPVAQRTAKFLKEQAPVVAENAEPTAARASEIAEGLAHEVRCLVAAPAQPACARDKVCAAVHGWSSSSSTPLGPAHEMPCFADLHKDVEAEAQRRSCALVC